MNTPLVSTDYTSLAMADGFSLDDLKWIADHSEVSADVFFTMAHDMITSGKSIEHVKRENGIPLAYTEDKDGNLMPAAPEIVAPDEAQPIALQMAKGIPAKTIDNFLEIFHHDPKYDHIRFNVMSNRAECFGFDPDIEKQIWKPWDDIEESRSQHYIERTYGLYNREKHLTAFKVLCGERKCNPVADMLRSLPAWDGEERCKYFLQTVLQADDNEYTRFVSQVIFDAADSRIFKPGCKYDLCVVLVGEKSGEGKSTIVRWLAMDDEYAGEIKSLDRDPDKIFEDIAGKWIVEIGEYLMSKSKRIVDSTKAFITRTQDTYRTKYNRYTDTIQRRCIFIATTNHSEFLSDPSGNRRWLPVPVYSSGDVVGQEKPVREYIKQCYAEAVCRFNNGESILDIPASLKDEVRKRQELATVEDYRKGDIEEYCLSVDYTANPYIFASEILQDLFNLPRERIDKKSVEDINDILRTFPFLEYKQIKCKGKNQRGFEFLPDKLPKQE